MLSKDIHIEENQQVSSWNLCVCRGQAASLLHGRGRCRGDESDTQNKNKYLHLTTILFCPRSIMFYLYICLGQAAMSTLQGKIILSIKGSHDVYQEFILLLQTDSKLLLWLSDIWRCTFVTNSNFSFYSHITIIWHLTWEAWLQCSLSKLKKKDKKLVQMFSTNTTTIVPLPWRIVHFKYITPRTQVTHTSSASVTFGLFAGQNWSLLYSFWTIYWSELVISVHL